jgi:hypothetical protein
MELTVRHLQQRNEIFEDGLASIRSTLVESSRAFSAHHNNTATNNTNDTPDAPSASNSRSNPRSSSSTTDDSTAPLSNATTYLLSLHESLREEVAQLSHAITDLDTRASMAIMNECLRLKEDMAHTNAAVNSVRMQVQWLMNPRLHQGQRAAAAGASTGGQNSGDGRAGSSAAGLLRSRRLSDTGREGTKL